MINSVHLTSAKPSLEFLISNNNFEEALLGFFPYRAYVSHKNDSPNLTQKVEWPIKGLVVSLSILLL